MSFEGFIAQGLTIKITLPTRNTSSVPLNADAAPRFIVYNGQTDARVDALQGQASQKHTGTITNVSAANPAVVTTSAAHGLVTGTRSTIASVVGSASMQTLVNTSHTVTKVSDTTFSLDNVNTTGETYTSGGTFNVAGLYSMSIDTTSLSSGTLYHVLATWAISSSQRHEVFSFFVV